jgi:AsmA protein
MKALKFIGFAFLALLALAALAAAVIAWRFDPAWAKQKLTQAVQQEKQRTLTIDGDVAMSFYPSIGLQLGKASLSERNSTEPFASIGNARVSVRVLPLLSRQVVVDRIELDGMRARIVRGKDGRFNFRDLVSTEGADGKGSATPSQDTVGFDIAGVRITRSALSVRDDSSGRAFELTDVSARTGRISQAANGRVELAFKIDSRQPLLKAAVDLSGNYRYDLAARQYAFDGIALTARGTWDAHPLDVKFEVPRIDGTASALDAGNLAVEWNVRQGPLAARGKAAGPAKVNLESKNLTLPKLAGELQIEDPRLPMKQLKLPLDASLQVDWGASKAAGSLSTRVEDSPVKARFEVAKFSPLQAGFDVAIDRLDLDRYFPETAPAGAAAAAAPAPAAGHAAPLDFSFLRGLALNGALKVGFLQARNLKLNNVASRVVAANGRLELDPLSADLYGGHLAGSLRLQAEGNRIALKQAMNNVAIGPLVRDYAHKDILEGRGQLLLDVTASGNSVVAARQSLNGSARLSLRDGSVKGINLAKTLREGKAMLAGGKQDAVVAANKSEKTDFSEMAASFRITNGVARNDDLSAKSPFLRVTGAGSIDLVREQLDYLAKVTVVASATGQEGKELADLNGLTIPVKLTGPYDKPSYRLEFGALAASLAKQQVQKRVEQQLEKQLGDKKGLGDVLKGFMK